MRKMLFTVLVALAGCGGAGARKADVNDDFSGIGDEKSDSFSSRLKIVGALARPEGNVQFAYTKQPVYRAIKLQGAAGDWVKITVRGQGTMGLPKVPVGGYAGDPVTFLLDSRFNVIAKNDDATASTSDSRIVTQLRSSGTFYVVVRDYSYQPINFAADLALARPSTDLIADANTWFQFFIADGDYQPIAERFAIPLSRMPKAAQADANGFFKKDVGGASGYALPYRASVMYMLTGSAEEAYDARPYDAAGNPNADIAIGGDASEIAFGPAKGSPRTGTN